MVGAGPARVGGRWGGAQTRGRVSADEVRRHAESCIEKYGKVLDRDRILDLLTGAERSPFDRSIDVRVTRLRAKLEADPTAPVFFKTIWGKGYMFCPEGDG